MTDLVDIHLAGGEDLANGVVVVEVEEDEADVMITGMRCDRLAGTMKFMTICSCSQKYLNVKTRLSLSLIIMYLYCIDIWNRVGHGPRMFTYNCLIFAYSVAGL